MTIISGTSVSGAGGVSLYTSPFSNFVASPPVSPLSGLIASSQSSYRIAEAIGRGPVAQIPGTQSIAARMFPYARHYRLAGRSAGAAPSSRKDGGGTAPPAGSTRPVGEMAALISSDLAAQKSLEPKDVSPVDLAEEMMSRGMTEEGEILFRLLYARGDKDPRTLDAIDEMTEKILKSDVDIYLEYREDRIVNDEDRELNAGKTADLQLVKRFLAKHLLGRITLMDIHDMVDISLPSHELGFISLEVTDSGSIYIEAGYRDADEEWTKSDLHFLLGVRTDDKVAKENNADKEITSAAGDSNPAPQETDSPEWFMDWLMKKAAEAARKNPEKKPDIEISNTDIDLIHSFRQMHLGTRMQLGLALFLKRVGTYRRETDFSKYGYQAWLNMGAEVDIESEVRAKEILGEIAESGLVRDFGFARIDDMTPAEIASIVLTDSDIMDPEGYKLFIRKLFRAEEDGSTDFNILNNFPSFNHLGSLALGAENGGDIDVVLYTNVMLKTLLDEYIPSRMTRMLKRIEESTTDEDSEKLKAALSGLETAHRRALKERQLTTFLDSLEN